MHFHPFGGLEREAPRRTIPLVRTRRFLLLPLLLGIFGLPLVPTRAAAMVCPMQAAPGAGCCPMARECSRVPVSFTLGLAFDHGRRASARETVAAGRTVAVPSRSETAALVTVFPQDQPLPPRPFSLLSVWRN